MLICVGVSRHIELLVVECWVIGDLDILRANPIYIGEIVHK